MRRTGWEWAPAGLLLDNGIEADQGLFVGLGTEAPGAEVDEDLVNGTQNSWLFLNNTGWCKDEALVLALLDMVANVQTDVDQAACPFRGAELLPHP